jgi:hypothetical protein
VSQYKFALLKMMQKKIWRSYGIFPQRFEPLQNSSKFDI